MKVYACLVGNWVCLNDDPEATIGHNEQSPNIWYEENGDIWAPYKRQQEHTYIQLDYVHVFYKGVDYRINPIFIQIVRP